MSTCYLREAGLDPEPGWVGDWPRDKKSLLQRERKHHDTLREGGESPGEGHCRPFSCLVHPLRHINKPQEYAET